MDNLFSIDPYGALALLVSTVGIYFGVILFTRLAGKRSFSAMSAFDFAMTVAVGSIIATTMLSARVSLLQGLIGLAMLYLLQILVAFSRRHSGFKKAIDNSPTLLMYDGKVLEENLRHSRLTHGDLRSKLRKAGVRNLQQIEAVVFETTGDVSIIFKDPKHNLDPWLLEDVEGYKKRNHYCS